MIKAYKSVPLDFTNIKPHLADSFGGTIDEMKILYNSIDAAVFSFYDENQIVAMLGVTEPVRGISSMATLYTEEMKRTPMQVFRAARKTVDWLLKQDRLFALEYAVPAGTDHRFSTLLGFDLVDRTDKYDFYRRGR